LSLTRAKAVPDLVESAAETALIVTATGLGSVEGATYIPDALIRPTVAFPPATPPALQVTAVFEVPETVAVNCSVPARGRVAVAGETETVMFVGVPELGVAAAVPPDPLPPPPQERLDSDKRSRAYNQTAIFLACIELLRVSTLFWIPALR